MFGKVMVNAAVLDGIKHSFSIIRGIGSSAEHKIHDLVKEKPKKFWNEWNIMWVKSIGFINKTLRENIAVRAYMRNADGPMLENCWVFWKQIKPLHAESKLSDFLHQSDDQKILSWYLL